MILISPSWLQIINHSEQSSLLEKRKLNEYPKNPYRKSWSSEYEAYYDDHFRIRQLLVKNLGKLKTGLLGVSPKPVSAQIGSGGFLFYNDITDNIFRSYSNQNLLSEQDLANMIGKLMIRKNN